MDTNKKTPEYLDAAKKFEEKWRNKWVKENLFKTLSINDKNFDASKPKKVILDFFPYPSGYGLHIGHPLGYIATDVISRTYRMMGYNVLHSMGFDSFGLPAEQYAIQTNRHPRETTAENVANITRQLQFLGFDHDEDARFLSSEPEYYKWTQWLFLKLYDSYFDENEIWIDNLGNTVKGKAKPVQDLREKLKNASWRQNHLGEIAPKDDKKFTKIVPENKIEEVIDANRLAVLKNVDVNWCPGLGTVLANEEVTPDGRSERGNFPVYRKPLKQWVLRITCYADRLYNDLNLIDWPRGVVEMQREWIGPSNGALVSFLAEDGTNLNVFTTRPDTLPGVTFVAVAPEHPLAIKYAADAAKKMVSLARNRAYDDKSVHNGVFTGQYVLHPITKAKIPVWVGDYVLSGYGEGAVMGVPAHDQRDFEFALRFDIPIIPVIEPPLEWLKENAPSNSTEDLQNLYLHNPQNFKTSYEGDGKILPNLPGAEELAGINNRDAIKKICEKLENLNKGSTKKTYRLRDWLFSRQRYWGEPFPIVYDAKTGKTYPIEEEQLPVLLPEVNDFRPVTSDDKNAEPVTPLGRVESWVKVKGIITKDGKVKITNKPEDNDFIRDTNTMPNWAGSCWYYLRYFDPNNNDAFVNKNAEKYWAGKQNGAVDLYVGGAEHAVLHLLYARFWHKVFFDLGLVSTPEPFQKLFNQGMITADAFRDSRGFYVDVNLVEEKEENGKKVAYNKETGEKLSIDPGKMGKRYKNGISPEEAALRHSTDALRCYMMFLGPLDSTSPWREAPIIGTERFLTQVWKLAHRNDLDFSDKPADQEIERILHKTIESVTNDILALRLNTPISSLMILTNALCQQKNPKKEHIEILLRLLAPYAPFLVEEIYDTVSYFNLPEGIKSVAFLPWPKADKAKTISSSIKIIVQINGKKRAEFIMPNDASDAQIEQEALKLEPVIRHINNMPIKRMIHIKQKDWKVLGIVI